MHRIAPTESVAGVRQHSTCGGSIATMVPTRPAVASRKFGGSTSGWRSGSGAGLSVMPLALDRAKRNRQHRHRGWACRQLRPPGRDIGAVWVFIRSGGVWTQQGSKLVGAR
jgi:hypothetical protein